MLNFRADTLFSREHPWSPLGASSGCYWSWTLLPVSSPRVSAAAPGSSELLLEFPNCIPKCKSFKTQEKKLKKSYFRQHCSHKRVLLLWREERPIICMPAFMA